MNKLKRLGFSLLGMLLPTLAFADASIGDLFRPYDSDKSMLHMSQLLGSVGNILHAPTNRQLMGNLFQVLNYGMLAVASLVVTYTIFTAVFRTASEGEWMGREGKVGWSVLRNVAGIGLLVPGASGYSLIQVFVVWAITQGIGLADNVWAKGFEYVQLNGVRISSSAGAGLPSFGSVSGESYIKKFIAQGFYADTCVNALNKMMTTDKREMVSHMRGSLFPNIRAQANMIAGAQLPHAKLYFTPAPRAVTGLESNFTAHYGFEGAPGKLANICGKFNLSGKADNEIYNQKLKIAFNNLNSGYRTVAHRVGNKLADKQAELDEVLGFSNLLQSSLLSSFTGWKTIIKMIETEALNQSVSDLRDTNNQAIKNGWMYAGGYYLKLSRVSSSAVKSMNIEEYSPKPEVPNYNHRVATPISYDFGPMQSDLKEFLHDSLGAEVDDPDVVDAETRINELLDNLSSKLSGASSLLKPTIHQADEALKKHIMEEVQRLQSNKASNKLDFISGNKTRHAGLYLMMIASGLAFVLGAGAIGGGLGIPVFLGMFMLMLAVVIVWDVTFASGSHTVEDPIVGIMLLGDVLSFGAIMMWIGVSLIGTLLASFGVLCSMQPGCEIFDSGRDEMLGIFNTFTVACLVQGAIMAVYVPMIPFLIYFFASLGWLISVLEAVVAAPLVALGITHPQGHDLLGKSEQGLMLLLSVFLRPTLIVIGLFAGMIFVRIALQVLKPGISELAFTILGGHRAANIFLVLGFLFAFTSLVVGLVNTSFSLIHIIPDRVMSWIGVTATGHDVGREAMQETKGAVSGATKGAAGGLGSATKGGVKGPTTSHAGGLKGKTQGKANSDAAHLGAHGLNKPKAEKTKSPKPDNGP